MDLVPAEPLQLVGVERLTERLFADQGPVVNSSCRASNQGNTSSFEEAPQTRVVGGDRFLASLVYRDRGPACRPTIRTYLAQRPERCLVAIIARGFQEVEGAARHSLVLLHFPDVRLRVGVGSADGAVDTLRMACVMDMGERHLHCLR